MPVTVIDPHLRAGWEPDTPASDSLLRAYLLNWTASVESNSAPLGARTLRRDDFAAVDVGRPSFNDNTATLLTPLSETDAHEAMAALDTFYRFSEGDTTGTVHLFNPYPTPDLRPYGWTLGDYMPLMLRPAGGAPPPPPPGLRIAAVHDKADMHAFEATIVRGFGADDLRAMAPGAVFSPALRADDRFSFWVGWEGDTPVCAAAAFVSDGINGVTLVATVPEARRRGHGAAVAWRATVADPALPALLLATDEGRPVYEQMGYLTLFRFTLWSRGRP